MPPLRRTEILMRKVVSLAAVVSTCLLARAEPLGAGQPLSLQVSPLTAMAPAFVRVSVAVEANPDNRSLEVVAQSADFYRSSRIALDGDHAPRRAVFEYRNLPPGLYEVSGVLVGDAGKRATVTRIVKVTAWAGSGR
jgi:hypothetical protein